MRRYGFEAKGQLVVESRENRRQVVEARALAAHAGVDLKMDGQRSGSDRRGTGGALKLIEMTRVPGKRSEVVRDECVALAREDAADDEDARPRADGAGFNALFNAGDSEPLGTGAHCRGRADRESMAVGIGLHYSQALGVGAGDTAENAVVFLERAGRYFDPAGACWHGGIQCPVYRADDSLDFTSAYATTVSVGLPSSSSRSSSRSCGTGISQAAISLSSAFVKQSSLQPRAPVSMRTGGPKTRQVMGRHA